jgi:O-antigen/teichoic acid export membrane protein
MMQALRAPFATACAGRSCHRWWRQSFCWPEFTSAYPVMAILVVGFLARASVGPAEFLLNMLGHQRAVAAVAVSAAVFDIALCALLIPHFGMLGAAIANAATLVFAAIAYGVVAFRRLGMKIFVLSHLRSE